MNIEITSEEKDYLIETIKFRKSMTDYLLEDAFDTEAINLANKNNKLAIKILSMLQG